jgi:hypothetical protein
MIKNIKVPKLALSSTFLLASLLLTQTACATEQSKWTDYGYDPTPSEPYQNQSNPISIDIIDDQGHYFNKHQYRNEYRTHRAYLEAKKGKRYKLRVRNHTNKRIAVVIAVDGRNIISGKKSNLQNNERMYVLDAYQTAIYKGWRTGQNKINRFYFTKAGDSYAAAWGDHSAMGVIAAAVYKEQPQYQSEYYSNKMAPRARRRSAAADEAGTGYGREEHSSSVTVSFRPQSAVAGKYFYKYEWRETLCKHSIIQCGPSYYQPENRLWPYNRQGNGAYAPPPPRSYWK